MAANLTPQYHKAEQAYRRAASPEEELEWLQVMLREMPKHKGTDKLQAELKHKIAEAKKNCEKQAAAAKKAAQPKIPRQGAGRAVIIGGPNAGKSSLLKALTRATPEVAPFPFTTREPQPAMMPWEDVQVQLIDTPPITADVFDASTLGLMRGTDVVLLMVDLAEDGGIDDLQAVLARVAQTKTRLAKESLLDENDIGVSYTKTLLIPNKIDLLDAGDRLALLHEFCPHDFPEYPISAEQGNNLEALRATIYQSLDVVRVYTKSPTKKEADFDRPYTVARGQTLLDVAEQVHKDFAENLKYARVWGTSIHPGSQVKGDYVLHDKDIVELHVS
jgi:ribosome-interacting GTPase 1